MSRFIDLLGTMLATFKIGRATLDASGLTAARTHTLPNKDGTFAMLSDVGGGGAAAADPTTIQRAIRHARLARFSL